MNLLALPVGAEFAMATLEAMKTLNSFAYELCSDSTENLNAQSEREICNSCDAHAAVLQFHGFRIRQIFADSGN